MFKFILDIVLSSLILSTSVYAKETIHVGTEPTFAPFGFIDKTSSKIVGFDIDIINAIGQAADLEVVVESMQFDGLIPAILSNSLDAAISGMTKNPQREKQVLFSDPYYVAGQDLMIKKTDLGKFKSMNDLQGRRVCVQLGSVGAQIAKDIKEAKILTFNTMTEAYIELGKDGCDAAITGTPVNQYYLVETKDPLLAHVPESVVKAADLGIITNKANVELMKKINYGLKVIKENGTYDAIYQKWFK